MSRPAGFSDEDEDSDFEAIGCEPVRWNNRVNHIERVLTPEEKLFDAVSNNDVTALAAAIAEGADIHFRTKGNTPIMQAALEGHFAVMELLIQNGANVNDDLNMNTVVMCLCNSWSRNEEELLRCLRLLLEHGADPNATDWTLVPPIIMAARAKHILLVTHLLEIGCNVNAEDADGYTPLRFAVQNEHLDMVRLLLESGAKVNVMDRRGDALTEMPQVSENQELAALLGIAPDDDSVEEVQQPNLSNFKRAMLSVPKKNGRLYGFHEDAVRLVKGIGLYDVAKILEENNVQLAELLTWSSEDWDRSGIHISYYQRKIALCAKKYHERPWGKGATPKVSSVISEGQVDPFLVVLFLLDFLRVMHISSATSLHMLKNFDGPLTAEALEAIRNAFLSNSLSRKLLKNIRQRCVSLESSANTVPPDLITVNDLPKRSTGFCMKFVGFVSRWYISWRLPSCSNV